jgi:hypothetical protein
MMTQADGLMASASGASDSGGCQQSGTHSRPTISVMMILLIGLTRRKLCRRVR